MIMDILWIHLEFLSYKCRILRKVVIILLKIKYIFFDSVWINSANKVLIIIVHNFPNSLLNGQDYRIQLSYKNILNGNIILRKLYSSFSVPNDLQCKHILFVIHVLFEIFIIVDYFKIASEEEQMIHWYWIKKINYFVINTFNSKITCM